VKTKADLMTGPEWETAVCAKCGVKPKCLFSPCQLKRKKPVCVECRKKPRNRVEW
jgi:hypothetical protein